MNKSFAKKNPSYTNSNTYAKTNSTTMDTAHSTYGSKGNYQKSKITNTGNFNRYASTNANANSKPSYNKYGETHQSTRTYEKKPYIPKNKESKLNIIAPKIKY